MLSHLEIRNFKALKAVDLDLRPLTVLVGANGVGKTSVLDAVALLSSVAVADKATRSADSSLRDPYQFLFTGLGLLPDLGSAYGSLLELVKQHEWPISRSWRFVRESGWNLRASFSERPEQLQFAVSWMNGSAQIDTGWTKGLARVALTVEDEPAHKKILSALAQAPPFRAFLLRPTLSRLSEPSYSEAAVPAVEADGGGLASVLANLAATDPSGLDAIMENLRNIVPAVRRCRTPRHKLEVWLDFKADRPQPVWGHRLELEMEGVGWVPAEHLSEGTLRALAMLCAVEAAPTTCPFVFLADDFDAGLHPKAQESLVSIFRKIMERRPNVQFICTTHSPYVLDFFADDEVVVCARGADGAMSARPIASHPEWPKWKPQLRAGEFWSSFGEDWVLDAPSAPRAEP